MESGRYEEPVVIEIQPFNVFYDAEDYHQDDYKKNPVRYKFYTFNSGRYQFIDKAWGDEQTIDFSQFKPDDSSVDESASADQAFVPPSDTALREELTEPQYYVTQKDGT